MTLELTPQEIWSLILKEGKNVINQQAFERWLEPTKAVSVTQECIVVEVSNQFSVDYIENHFTEILSNIGTSLFDRNFTITFEPAKQDDDRVQEEGIPNHNPTFVIDEEVPSVESILHHRFTFENFVVGNSNQFAHAASLAVAEAPAKTYNPLFIYGGVGLGKTHLMQAIGNKVIKEKKLKRIHYSSTETFMNEMVQALQQGKMIDFRNKYRKVDLLLIDDVQFLANKESTQEEFFHTFNALYDSQKQIVLTCDRPPKEIPTLEERLVSRFTWGLVTDIQPPDLETRLAILKNKADSENLLIPDDVLMFIANNVRSNVRQLEGSLIRLLAHTSISNVDITLDLAKEALKSVIIDEIKKISVDKILKSVAQRYNIPVESLKSRTRTKTVSFPRQIAMYLCRLLTDLPLIEIGEAFGGRDHTTVMHASEKITEKLRTSKKFKQEISLLIEEVKNDTNI